MSTTMITHLHADPDHIDALAELITEGRDRMRTADGCEAFDLLRADDDPGAFVFIQRWDAPESHDTAFADKIIATGHLDKVLAAIDRPIEQHGYHTT